MAIFPVKKKQAFFLVRSNITNVRKHPTIASKVFQQVFCKLFDHFFRTSEVDNKIVQKKATFPVKKILDFFTQLIECDKPQWTFL